MLYTSFITFYHSKTNNILNNTTVTLQRSRSVSIVTAKSSFIPCFMSIIRQQATKSTIDVKTGTCRPKLVFSMLLLYDSLLNRSPKKASSFSSDEGLNRVFFALIKRNFWILKFNLAYIGYLDSTEKWNGQIYIYRHS